MCMFFTCIDMKERSDKDSPSAEAARELKKKKESPSADSPARDAKGSAAPDTNKVRNVDNKRSICHLA